MKNQKELIELLETAHHEYVFGDEISFRKAMIKLDEAIREK